MAHDLENPRTKNYSKFKSFLISLELILKKGWLFIFVIINIFFHTKKKNYINTQIKKCKKFPIFRLI